MAKRSDTISKLAEFVVESAYQRIPRETTELAKQLILHCLGGMLGGTQETSARVVIDFVRSIGGVPEAAVVGCGFKSSAVNAALVGGVTPHAIEVEDASWPGASSTITLVPVILALGERDRLPGKDLIEAFVIGFEIQGRLALAASNSANKRGVSTLAAIGTFGAATAAAKLLKLDVNGVKDCLGIAASQAAGLNQPSVGYMTHFFQSGAACRNGLTAALLAKGGCNANPCFLEMRHGVLDVLCGEKKYSLATVAKDLGSPFYLHQVRVKKYPSCILNHRINDGVLALVRDNDISYEEVASIEIGVNTALSEILHYPEPGSVEQARFSLQYNVATAVMARKVDLDEFTYEHLFDPKRREFMKRIRMVVHPEWDSEAAHNLYLSGANPLVMKLHDGREFSCNCAYATGGPEAPLSAAEIIALFRPIAKRVLSESAVQRIQDLVMDLENVEDPTELAMLLLGNGR